MSNKKIFSARLFLGVLMAAGALCTTARAQFGHAQFDKLSLEHGLSQTTVSAIVQDRYGFIWFGSRNGLNKYDGYHFTVYKNRAFDSNSISDNWITSLFIDKDGYFWVGTLNKGLNRFDALTEKVEHYFHQPGQDNGLPNNRVQAITQDGDGRLWIGTMNGLCRYDGKSFVQYFHDPDNPNTIANNQITSLSQDRRGYLWIGTENGLTLYNGREFKNVLSAPGARNNMSIRKITALAEDSSGFLWVGTEGDGVYKVIMDQDKPMIISHYLNSPAGIHGISDNNILKIYTDRNGGVWIGTMKGLNLYLKSSDQFKRFLHDSDDPSSLSNNEIRSIYQDQSGILWIGTYGGGGINKLDLKTPKFHHRHYEPKKSGSLSDDVVRCFLKDRSGCLWVGTHIGLNRYDKLQQEFTSYKNNPADPGSISDDEIRSLRQDKDGILWIGTEMGLNRFDPENKGKPQFTSYRHNPLDFSSLSHNHVFTIHEDEASDLWIGTNGGGVNRFNKKTRKFLRFLHNPNDSLSISNNFVSVIYGDRKGTIWIGTFGGGLNRLVRTSGDRFTFEHFRNNPADRGTISGDVVYSICEDQKGRIWVGTNTGLNLMNTEEGSFSVIDHKNGLPDIYIYGVMEDDQGYLWLSSVGGLTRYHHDTKTIRNYDIMDGLQSNEFKLGSYYKAPDGEMFFGGVRGFNNFYPRDVRDNPFQPPVVVTSFHRSDDPALFLDDQLMLQAGKIAVSYGENFYFEFSSLDYTCPQKNQYSYRLAGYDEDWTFAGNRRIASYTNLDGGSYVFEVRGTNSDGIWSGMSASVPVYIHPPFWQTWWFRIASAAFLVMLAFLGYEWRLRSVRRYNEILEHKVQERTKELRDTQHQLIQSEKISAVGRMVAGITHEINNPLAFIIGNLAIFKEYVERLIQIIEIVRQKSGEPTPMNAEQFSRVIDSQDYQMIKTDVFASMQSCHKGAERIRNLIQNLRDFSILGERDLVSTNINDEVLNVIYQVKDKCGERIKIVDQFSPIPPIECFPSLLRLVFTNIVTNAIEAISGEGVITVATEAVRNEHIRISIRDTGKGMSVDTLSKIYDPFFTTKAFGQGTGLGLSISYGIVKTHKGDIDVKSQLGKGTEFIITLPIHSFKDRIGIME